MYCVSVMKKHTSIDAKYKAMNSEMAAQRIIKIKGNKDCPFTKAYSQEVLNHLNQSENL